MIRPASLGEVSSNLNAAIQTLWENGIAIPVSSFKAAAQLAAHNLHVQRKAAASLQGLGSRSGPTRQNEICHRAGTDGDHAGLGEAEGTSRGVCALLSRRRERASL
jgi:hypothetical protein